MKTEPLSRHDEGLQTGCHNALANTLQSSENIPAIGNALIYIVARSRTKQIAASEVRQVAGCIQCDHAGGAHLLLLLLCELLLQQLLLVRRELLLLLLLLLSLLLPATPRHSGERWRKRSEAGLADSSGFVPASERPSPRQPAGSAAPAGPAVPAEEERSRSAAAAAWPPPLCVAARPQPAASRPRLRIGPPAATMTRLLGAVFGTRNTMGRVQESQTGRGRAEELARGWGFKSGLRWRSDPPAAAAAPSPRLVLHWTRRSKCGRPSPPLRRHAAGACCCGPDDGRPSCKFQGSGRGCDCIPEYAVAQVGPRSDRRQVAFGKRNDQN